MKSCVIAIAVLAVLFAAGCGGGGSSTASVAGAESSPTETSEEAWPIEPAGELQGQEFKVKPPKGPPPKKLIIKDLRVGDGDEAKTGDKVTIEFSAIHYSGKIFETSWEFGTPFRFELGNEKVSPGWEKGLPGMRVGGRRELIVPWDLVSQSGILPGSTPKDGQVYVVELLDVS